MSANNAGYLKILGGLKCLYCVVTYVAVAYYGGSNLFHNFSIDSLYLSAKLRYFYEIGSENGVKFAKRQKEYLEMGICGCGVRNFGQFIQYCGIFCVSNIL